MTTTRSQPRSVFCRPLRIAALMVVSLVPYSVLAQPGPRATDVGIPVTSPVVRQQCGSCHQSDAEGRMSRISYQRTTPEGWQQTIRRMVLLNGLEIDPAAAREAVRYLANGHGLAPEEARAAAFEVERRLVDYYYAADPATQETCNRCHSMGRVLTQRRTPEEWQLLTAMHQGYYPLVDFQSFYRTVSAAGENTDGDDEPGPYPVELAVEHLSQAFPLDTSEWAAWSANMRDPRLVGQWSLVGSQRGRGPVYGQVEIAARAGSTDGFDTRISYTYARTGQTVERTGQSVVFTGFQWRGRSSTTSEEMLQEVMFVDRDWQGITGRWFTGNHDEIGLDIRLERVASGPTLTGVYPPAVRVGDSANRQESLTIYGVDLPDDLATMSAAVDLGPGLDVVDIAEASRSRAVLELTVAADAAVGARDLFLGDSFLLDAVSVYDDVHRLEVTPDTGMARVGGAAFPKRFEQFEARAFHNGPDGVANTADDLDLGLPDVTWSLEEYAAIYGDDDIEFVGRINQEGFFTPALDGPNPERRNNANNVGDVWVVATAAGSDDASTLRARAHLLVTVPLYIRRDASPEVQ